MRHVLVHDYYQIDSDQVWVVIQDDLTPLHEQITRYLAETNWEEWEKNEVAIVVSSVQVERAVLSSGKDGSFMIATPLGRVRRAWRRSCR